MRLHLDGVGVRAGAARLVRDVTVDCASGSFVGLLGPNGSGKSTLLRTVYRALAPDTGTIRLDGRDLLRGLTAREAARCVAVLAQDPGDDAGFTVGEVVATGRTPHHGSWSRWSAADRAVVAGALDATGMSGREHRAFATLSGGEKQRALLARALAQQPSVLILDEPTNHLDLGTQLSLLGQVRGLGVTVLAALHDLNLAAAYCDRVHLLRAGAVVAHGTPDEVLTPARVAEVYGVTVHRVPHPDTGRPHLIPARTSEERSP